MRAELAARGEHDELDRGEIVLRVGIGDAVGGLGIVAAVDAWDAVGVAGDRWPILTDGGERCGPTGAQHKGGCRRQARQSPHDNPPPCCAVLAQGAASRKKSLQTSGTSLKEGARH